MDSQASLTEIGAMKILVAASILKATEAKPIALYAAAYVLKSAGRDAAAKLGALRKLYKRDIDSAMVWLSVAKKETD